MVVNTILSVMAYDYPPEKLSVYLSDDGGSDITFYALWEASSFSRYWLPYCRNFKVESTSPAAYFKCTPLLHQSHDFTSIKMRSNSSSTFGRAESGMFKRTLCSYHSYILSSLSSRLHPPSLGSSTLEDFSRNLLSDQILGFSSSLEDSY
ncbi:hypothetical protein V2J09_010806 [Rumex salicifolius]